MTTPRPPDRLALWGQVASNVGCILMLVPVALVLLFVLFVVTGGYGLIAIPVGIFIWLAFKNRGRQVQLRRRPPTA